MSLIYGATAPVNIGSLLFLGFQKTVFGVAWRTQNRSTKHVQRNFTSDCLTRFISEKNRNMAKFEKGNAGGPGRPKGSVNAVTKAAYILLEGEAEALSRKAVDMALEGDIQALRLCMERILPRAKDAPIQRIELPTLDSAESVLEAISKVAAKLSAGEMLPSEASSICAVLGHYQRHYELTEIENRLQRLERESEID